MEKYLNHLLWLSIHYHQQRLKNLPNESTFKNVIIENEVEKEISETIKLQLLINDISPKVYEYAIATLY